LKETVQGMLGSRVSTAAEETKKKAEEYRLSTLKDEKRTKEMI